MAEERTCAWCGADISHRGPRAFSCGSKCAHHIRKSLKGPLREVRQCAECGADFEAKTTWAKYCSLRCKRKPQSRKLSAARKGVWRKCKTCGGDFRAYRSSKTCSPECSKEAQRENVRRWDRDHLPKKIGALRRWRSENPEKVCEAARARHRRRAAAKAIALLILPVEQQETDQ